MEILDYILIIFLGWVAYDTVKEDGWVFGLYGILVVFTCALVVVIVPYFFGDIGKNILLALLIFIIGFMVIRKRLKNRIIKK